MKLVAAAVLLCLGCACAARQNNLYKNKRIIKVRVPPRQYPDFYNGPKGYLRPSGSPIRFKEYHTKHNEFIRPNHPPFYSSFNNIYVKHQSRPPPPQKIPSFPYSGPGFGQAHKGHVKEFQQSFPLTYGSSFPHKASFSSFKFPSVKDEIRITHPQTVSSSSSGGQSSSSLSSSSSSSSSSLSPSLSPSLSSSLSSSSSLGTSFSAQHQPTSYYVSSGHSHVQSSDDNRGPIKEIPAPDLGPKPDGLQGDAYATYGKGPSIDVTNLVSDQGGQQLTFPATEYYSAFGHGHNFNAIGDNALSTGSGHGSNFFTVEHHSAALEDSARENSVNEGAIVSTSSHDYKSNEISVTAEPSPSSGYEVTEETSASGSSDTGSSHYYYAPDPDPSLPVHKVPSAKEEFSNEKLSQTYVPQVTQNFQILEGGSVAAPVTTLSTQELFQLMHGFPTQTIPQAVVAEPVVTILGHHQPGGVYLQPHYAYAQAGHVNGGYAHASQGGGNDFGQFQQRDASHQILIQHQQHQQQQQQQETYIPQQSVQQYQSYSVDYSQSGDPTSEQKSYVSSDESGNGYEPEASESRKHGSLMKMDEESPNSVESTSSQQDNQIIIHFNKLPEVPFYTTLPNKEAAEALATLQAAGSIGSNYVERIKGTNEEKEANAVATYVRLRGDQGAESDDYDEYSEAGALGLPQQELATPQKVEPEQKYEWEGEGGQEGEDSTGSDVEVQQSIPLYETSYSATSLLDDGSSAQSAGGDVKTGSFGKRIRPK